MSALRRNTGLGIDMGLPRESSGCDTLSLTVEPGTSSRTVSASQSAPRVPSKVGDSDLIAPPSKEILANGLGMRSLRSMHGLLQAEVGGAMVELDVYGGGSGFKQGQHILPQAVSPTGGSNLPRIHASRQLSVEEYQLSRHGTLLSSGVNPTRNAAELKSLLGNSNMRLKRGAKVLPPAGQWQGKRRSSTSATPTVHLEQAKPRARVEVDIDLQSNVCVQGGQLAGKVKVRVRERSKKEAPVLLSDGKVRLVGFECLPNHDDRHTFYQCSSSLSSITTAPHTLYLSPPDLEGFAEAREGVHVLPFTMDLPIDSPSGNAKGILHVHSGVSVRYIALISVKVKDSQSGRRSIAHFYRFCEVWPRLDPSVVLASSPRPILGTTCKPVFMGGPGRLKLTATLHRLHWVAGQRCFVNVSVANDTKKTVRSLMLSLIRTTTVFKPQPDLDTHPHAADPDSCQTSTSQKTVAESILEMGQTSAKGHASAKGWWTGVAPGRDAIFSHYIMIPPEALSVARGRLLEVEYTIRVSVSAGSLTSDVHVTLPIRIVNFLSLDPPPNFPVSSDIPRLRTPSSRRPLSGSIHEVSDNGFSLDCGTARHDTVPDPKISKDELRHRRRRSSSLGSQPSNCYGTSSHLTNPHVSHPTSSAETDSDWEDSDYPPVEQDDGSLEDDDPTLTSSSSNVDSELLLGNLSLDDGADFDSDKEVVDFVVGSARPDDMEYSRFSDLYHHDQHRRTGQQEETYRPRPRPREASHSHSHPHPIHAHAHNSHLPPTHRPSKDTSVDEPRGRPLNRLRSKTTSDIPKVRREVPAPGGGPSSFAMRVQEKLMAVAADQASRQYDLGSEDDDDDEGEEGEEDKGVVWLDECASSSSAASSSASSRSSTTSSVRVPRRDSRHYRLASEDDDAGEDGEGSTPVVDRDLRCFDPQGVVQMKSRPLRQLPMPPPQLSRVPNTTNPSSKGRSRPYTPPEDGESTPTCYSKEFPLASNGDRYFGEGYLGGGSGEGVVGAEQGVKLVGTVTPVGLQAKMLVESPTKAISALVPESPSKSTGQGLSSVRARIAELERKARDGDV